MAGLALGCGTQYAQTASQPSDLGSDASTPPPVCGTTLASRLVVTTIDLDDDVRYKRDGYNFVPTDARLAFGVAATGNSYVAWANNAGDTLHITPLTALQTRLGSDTLVPGHEVGGLVAQNDGFTMLAATDDPGTRLLNPNRSNEYGWAAVAVRVKQGSSAPFFVAPLTGTASIVNAAAPLYDCTPEHFDGRLAFNGSKYGAYFTVHGCQGAVAGREGYYADKLAYFDDQGQAVAGGWDWGCQIDEDLRLLPEPGQFTSLCMADVSASGGLNLVREGAPQLTLLSPEFVQKNVCAAQFGSIVKLPNGTYALLWLSRGGSNGDNTLPLKSGNDIAMMTLTAAPDYTPSAVTWIKTTPSVHEMNLHVAAYGSSRLLVSWDSIENFDCTRLMDPYQATCLGTYTGTHFQLFDTLGKPAGPDEILQAPPNERDDLVTFPNGDVGWAFVPDPGRGYATRLPLLGQIPQVPAIRKISIARLLYCP